MTGAESFEPPYPADIDALAYTLDYGWRGFRRPPRIAGFTRDGGKARSDLAVVLPHPSFRFSASNERDFWDVHTEVDGKQPVQVGPQNRNRQGPWRIERPHLKVDYLRKAVVRLSIEGAPAYPKTEVAKPRADGGLNLIDGYVVRRLRHKNSLGTRG